MRCDRWRASTGCSPDVCVLLLFVGGVPTFDAICLALLDGLDRRLHAGRRHSVASIAAAFAEVVVAVFMLIGATSIVWHRMVLEGGRAMLGSSSMRPTGSSA